ncbi:hypothetical protein RZS08_06270 [Arthrospira platensis SPKY1]|nr:hypothetical protein [Arthrospira platensis SPKY1]
MGVDVLVYSKYLCLHSLLLPYKIGLSLYDYLDYAGLLAHIDRVGMLFYDRRREMIAA